jgi:hypothetical protein
MKTWWLLIPAMSVAVGPVAGQEGFRFPDDSAGKRFQAILPPGDAGRVVTPAAGPKSFKPLRSLELPEVPLLPSQAGPATLPGPTAPPALKPGQSAEATPLTTTAASRPAMPSLSPLATGMLVRIDSASVEKAVAVPVLARPVPDRASLDDPTRDASLVAALSAEPPTRPGPAPFVKLGTPDPFENREVVRLRALPPEFAVPVSISPRTPR